MKKLSTLYCILAVIWLACWIAAAPYSMLDDALIHLRYASFLHTLHHITYDGIHFTYGTSSLLYVFLLSLLRGISLSPVLPRVVSIVSYALLLILLFRLRSRFRSGTTPRFLWLALLLATLAPMAIRWLTDGMETSIVLIGIVALAVMTVKLQHDPTPSPILLSCALLLGAALVLTRIELLMPLFLSACAIAAIRLEKSPKTGFSATILASCSMLLGGAIAFLGIRIVFGHWLPDTALAKSGSFSLDPLFGFARVTASAFAFGIGVALLTLLSAVLALRAILRGNHARGRLAAWLAINACLPVELLLACMRDQAVQGIRYIVWAFYLAILWNALESAALLEEPSAEAAPKPVHRALWATYAVLFLCLLPFDARFALRAMRGRSQTFQQMRYAGLEKYKNATVIAGDVGFIGYFTGAQVCDIDGLVNGRQRATLSKTQRLQVCAKDNPGLLFLTTSQLSGIAPFLDVNRWKTSMIVDFRNVSSNDRHYLMLPAAR